MDELTGVFYRIVAASDVSRILEGARSPEGRFHHSSQPALYVSSSVEKALKAIEVYRRPDEEERIAIPLQITGAKVVDLRNARQCARMSINPTDAAVPWQPQRQRGERPDSWRPADFVRKSGADGMIYTARSAPERWHVVLFKWNVARAPSVAVAGPPIPIAAVSSHPSLTIGGSAFGQA